MSVQSRGKLIDPLNMCIIVSIILLYSLTSGGAIVMSDENKIRPYISLENQLSEQVKSLAERGYSIENYSVNMHKKCAEIIYSNNQGVRYRETLDVLNDGIINVNSKFNTNLPKKDLIDSILSLKERGYSQVEISRMTGVSQSYVSQLLKGRGE
jgi:hypothetical protein